MDAGDRLPASADVVIVGGGIVGTSAAYFLSTETDSEVLLLERDTIASGSTGDSSAIIRHHYGDRAVYTDLAAWSHEFFRNFQSETGEEIAYVQNPLVRFGVDNEPSGREAQAGYDVLEDRGIPVSRHDGAELDSLYPLLSTDGIDFGVSDDTAAYSDASDVAGGFSRAAQKAGASIVTDLGATGFRIEDGAIAGVTTDAGTVKTGSVIVAAGPWSKQIAKWVDVELPLTTTREQILLLEPSDELSTSDVDDLPTTSKPGADWYMRPDFGEGVLMATHHTGDPADPDTYKRDPDEETILQFIDELDDFVPALSDGKLRGGYCGIYSETPDRGFIIDQAGPAGCYFACGFSGHGFKTAPAVGKILSGLVVDGDGERTDNTGVSVNHLSGDYRSPVDISLDHFALDRFDREIVSE